MGKKLVSQEAFRRVIAEKRDFFFLTEKAREMYQDFLPPNLKEIKTPKEILFPRWEEVYRYFFRERSWKLQEVSEDVLSPSFLVLLPCEAKAVIEVLDVNFLGKEYVDQNYLRRRMALHLVILGCTTHFETCFCHLVGGSPLWRHEEHLFLVPFKGQFYVENDEENLFGEGQKVSAGEEEEFDSWEREVQAKLPPSLPPDFPQKLYTHFDDEEWKDITWRCINCGACTFLCPTCYCFDLSVDGKLRGSTLKTWDSCMFPRFTLHASSHNPRPTGKERVRQRVMHKFSYFPLREKHYGCVGCGICREICPVNWDIKEAVERMVRRIESCVPNR